jgi:hypothetical protein
MRTLHPNPDEAAILLPTPQLVEWLAPVRIADLPGPAQARIAITLACRDCDVIPKAPNAGRIYSHEGELVQIMHDGSRIVAGGYYGDWMSRIIAGLHGHHEPQEEALFHGLLASVRPASLFVELGAYWAFYTNWYLGAVPGSHAVCVEPEAAHLEVGRRNLALNGREARLIHASVGGSFCPATADREIDCLDMPALVDRVDHERIEVLHMDVQGAETDFLRSMRGIDAATRVRFIVVSTHHAAISGSPTTHEDCLEELRSQGAFILDEHSIGESFSGDGLIVASFEHRDRWLRLPPITRAPEELSSLVWESASLADASATAGSASDSPTVWLRRQAARIRRSATDQFRSLSLLRRAS